MDCFIHKRKFSRIVFCTIFLGNLCLFFASALPSHASLQIGSRLTYNRQNSGAVPIPPAEKALQTVAATSYYQVTKENHLLSGSVIDDKGNLFFCDWTSKKIFRLTPWRRLSQVTEFKNYHPSDLSFGPDGRLYIAVATENGTAGGIYAVKPSGGELETILSPKKGFVPKNIVFNRQRGLYFTDFKGPPNHPIGGVYYLSPGLKAIQPVIEHLSLPNGVMVSPDQKILWVTEAGQNRLHRIELESATKPKKSGWNIPYHFTGLSPAGISGGNDGNIYISLSGQGRVLIFNYNGLPIGQILISGRSRGHNLLASTVAIRPEGKSLYILSSDGDKGWGAGIFKQTSFGRGMRTQNFDSDDSD